MGCGCNGQTKAQYTYVFVTPTGEQRTYPTELEALAAQRRAGGGVVRKEAA